MLITVNFAFETEDIPFIKKLPMWERKKFYCQKIFIQKAIEEVLFTSKYNTISAKKY